MRRRTKWLLVAILIVVPVGMCAIGLFLLLGGRNAEEMLTELKAMGYPTDLEDLSVPPLADSENGAIEYRKAFDLASPITPEEKALLCGNSRHIDAREAIWTDAQLTALRKFADRNTEAVAYVEKASAKPRCVFVFDYSAGSETKDVSLSGLLLLADAVKARAVVALSEGKSETVLRDAFLLRRMAFAPAERKTLITALLSQRLATEAFGVLAVSVERGGIDSISPSDLVLLRQYPPYPSVDQVVAGELCAGFSHYRELGIGASNRRLILPARLLFGRDRRLSIDYMYKAILLCRRPWPDIKDQLATLDRGVEHTHLAFLFRLFTFPVSGLVRNFYAGVACLRQAHIALALALYRQEHGSYPESLDAVADLVGERNLEDPFGAVLKRPETSVTQARFIYRRTADGYLLYSIGPDLIDDGGKEYDRRSSEGDIVSPAPD